MKKLHRTILIFSGLCLSILNGSTTTYKVISDNRFVLSNNTYFSPGSEVVVNLQTYSSKKNLFIFRLLRISNPSEFFSNCELQNLRNNFDILGKDKDYLLKNTELVKEWKERLSPSSYYYNNILSVGKISKPGFYILQAFKRDQVAYCGILVTDLAMIYKYSSNQLLAFVSNSRTSEFVNDTKFNFYHNNNLIESKQSDKDGIVLFDLDQPLISSDRNSTFIIAQTDSEVVLSDPYFYFYHYDKNYTAYVYTNQPVYRPGQEVFFKAIIRDNSGDELLNVIDEEFVVTIKSGKNIEVYSSSLSTNDYGTLSGSFNLDDKADLGNYIIQIVKNDATYYGSFSVEEYKKPEYKINISTNQDNYSAGDLLEGKITADYYFGSKVKEGKVSLYLSKKKFWRPWWYRSEYAWFYRYFYSNDEYYYGDEQLIHQLEGALDENGEYCFSSNIDEKLDDDFVYTINAEVTDNSRRSTYERKEVFVTRGDLTISTSPEKHFFEKGKPIYLNVNISNIDAEPVETKFKVLIKYLGYSKENIDSSNQKYDSVIYGKTNNLGVASVEYFSSDMHSGYYSYTISTVDVKGKEITEDNFFYLGDRNYYYYGGTSSGLEIVTDKDAYDKGDSLIAHVFVPHENIELLLCYEKNSILSYRKIKTVNNSFTIREKLTTEYSPSFNISIAYFFDKQFYNKSKLIGVLDKDKLLNVEITPSKEIYNPGDDAEYSVSVKDINGNPVKNTELSFGVVDESIYAIREENIDDIQAFFYSPSYYKISANHSLVKNNFRGNSRTSSTLERNYFGSLESMGFGVCNFSGRVTIPFGDSIEYSVILMNEDNLFSAEIDRDGFYEFSLIDKGEYELYVADGSSLAFITTINTDEKKFDFNLKEYIDKFIKDSIYDDTGRTKDIYIIDEKYFEQKSTNTVRVIDSEHISRLPVMGITQTEINEDYLEAKLRSNFKDALIWKANIVTDRNGLAVVNFNIPDNLTTWRSTVKAVTKDSKMGQGVNRVISRKDLLVRMETPRFFREGDELTISTNIHNYLSESKKTKISFEVENLEVIDSKINSKSFVSNSSFSKSENNVYEINIEKNSELRIDWVVKVNLPLGEAKLTATALTNEQSDAVELKVPILPKGFREVNYIAMESSVDNPDELTFNIPEDVDLRTAKLSISINPSLAGTILKALDDLVGYPYGCVEQTMSRFLPTVIVANTFIEINAPLNASTIQELPKMVEAGLNRLYNFQHSDGGWGWWTNDPTHPHMTAYVLYGMSIAKNAGYNVNEEIYNKGIANLKKQIENYKASPDLDETTLAYMIFSLSTALKGVNYDVSFYRHLIQTLVKKELNPYTLSLIAISLDNMNSEELSNDIMTKLKTMVYEETSYAFWKGENSRYRWQSDQVQSTAFALNAIVKNDPNNYLIAKIVRWLIMQKQGYSWRSTQETAVVIFALTEYLKINNELNPDFKAIVYVNSKKVFEKHFTEDDIFLEMNSIDVSGLEENVLRSGTNKIKIIKEGEGKLYLSGYDQYYTKNQLTVKNNNSFKINREYFLLEPENKDGRFLYVKKDFNGSVKSGENIFVKTSVKSNESNLQYFILEDMLPSGFEPVKDERYLEIEGEKNYSFDDSYLSNWRWFYSDKEYRDDKVSFFVTSTKEEMEFSYILKAQIPGTYSAMPPIGALMYYPEVNSHGNIIHIVVDDNPF